MSTNFSNVLVEVNSISFGDIAINPSDFANVLQKYIVQGSKRYILSKDEIVVYANPETDFAGKETEKVILIGDKIVPITIEGLLATGTKFLDAVLFIALDASDKPTPRSHPVPRQEGGDVTFSKYADHSDIARCMFFCFFYLLTRARAPGADTDTNSQVVPQFLKTVLSISKGPREVADYLASFNINHIDPSWIKHIKFTNMSQEALNRFGLGVAGYRLVHPFKIAKPDNTGHDLYNEALLVARSFAEEPACWNFHPATRDANLLTKYGNINKNMENLMIRVYKKETLEKLVKIKALYQLPREDPSHMNFTTWSSSMIYKCQKPIFNNTNN